MATLSVGLDLGSTRIKAARLSERGNLDAVLSEDAPPLSGEGLVREGDPQAYLRAAERVLDRAREGLGEDVPLGMASQRSSFLLWEARTGTPVTPLLSWQDRRAEAWCRTRSHAAAMVRERTGLLLSPHYFGPKMAWLLEQSAPLRRRAADGELLAGTLDAWCVWNWSGRVEHRTDPTMAARTLLYSLDEGDWCDDLLDLFGTPRRILPRIEPSLGSPLALPQRGLLTASLSDQAGGLVALVGDAEDAALVNLGTGTFVLRPARDASLRPEGYLLGPVLAAAGEEIRYALEGPVNGGAQAASRWGASQGSFPDADPSPCAFCVPDSAGLGAPHWRADVSLSLSREAEALGNPDRRRVVLEGLVFRVREILEDLFPSAPPRSVLLAGGLAREPFLAQALAACLDRSVLVGREGEATLLGAARLAAGLEGAATGKAREVEPPEGGAWLREKFPRWRAWMREL